MSDSTPSVAHKGEAKLSRALKQRHVTMISLGGIIGAGLFVGSSAVITTIGPAAVLSYALAGLVVLLVMRMLGEMAIAIPGIGAFTEYNRVGLGDWAGFTSGWLYWYFWVIVVAVEVVVGAGMLHRWIPMPEWIIGIVLLSTMTVVNLLSVRSYGEFEYWFASLKVAAIIIFIVVAASYALGITSPAPTFGNIVDHGGFMPFGFQAVIAGVPMVIFAICGAEIATIAAAESDEPARGVASMTRSVIVRVLTFYVGSILLIVCVVPWDTLKAGHSPFVAAMDLMNIPYAGDMMNAVVLIAVLSCLNSGLYVASRVLFSLGQRGEAPAGMIKLSANRVPQRAILFSSVIGFVAVLSSIVSSEGVFLWLVNASGAIMLFIYLLIAAAQLRIRSRFEREAPQALSLRMWLFPWLTYAVIAAISAMLIAMALRPEFQTQFVASVVLLAVVLAIYKLRKTASYGSAAHLDQILRAHRAN
ncbi:MULTISPECIES: amino acid permease [Pseudomonas]|uniref:amino acid permease n=1 Tax=Pseudomonas nitroreducens TaxID=46680 RepID=UPI000567547E|nr:MULTISPECIES: amino acid permease [Pseudomonas]NNN28535.1 amino acid permease [Pseudomonas nitroreducens]